VYAHAAVEVHSVDTNGRVVLDAEIDVLRDTETEVASLREVALAELVFLDLEATLENLLGLGATDSNVNSDLLVTTDTEGSDSVAGLACNSSPSASLLLPFSHPLLLSIKGSTHCRLESDRSTARAPWRHA